MDWKPPVPAQVMVPPPKFNSPPPFAIAPSESGSASGGSHPNAGPGLAAPILEDSPEGGAQAASLVKDTSQTDKKGTRL
jgi:hypothetical protein